MSAQEQAPALTTEIASGLEQQFVELINGERRAEGLPDLKVEVHLNASAQSHSEWMADTGDFSHTGEDESRVWDRVEETGFPLEGGWRTTENIAYSSVIGDLDRGEVELMHDGLMDSPGHRENILDPEVSYVGIGIAVGEISVGGRSQDAAYVTQNFADTEGEVLVQEEVDGETVLQPYQDGEPVGDPEVVDPAPEDPDEETKGEAEEDDDDDDEDTSDGSGGSCFVATAAYGGRYHPDVASLRRFRDTVLVRHGAGRTFIRLYGLAGPVMARRVSHDGVSGRIVRMLISPVARMAGRWADRW